MRTAPLDSHTWDAFAELVERNNGIYGGCWCVAFHSEYHRAMASAAVENRKLKHHLVTTGHAHAALVFDDDDTARGWCQYGRPEELGRIKHRREYEKDPPPLADWRITCIFADRTHRGQGVARLAVEGALEQITAAGGGRIEVISEITSGRSAPGRFLFSATAELFESLGFTRVRQVGKHAWILSASV